MRPARRGLGRHTWRRGLLALAVGLALTLGAAGCAMSPQDQPDPVLLPSPSGAASPGVAQPGVPLSMQVYLIHGDRLQRVTRTVSQGTGMTPVLGALTAPLDEIELASGLRSAVPTTTRPLAGTVTNEGTARIAVPPGFDRLSVREQQFAMAQLVFTVTANTLASDVVLVNGSRVIAVPDARGELAAHPVTRQDYAELAPVR
ncbi:hypothetical protein GCM10027053_39260 [Intrasporangium mesophilum]